jgi:hypothetical protein
MSPAQKKFPQSSKSASPPETQTQANAEASPPPESPSSAETSMEQHLDSRPIAIPPTPPKVMSSTDSDSADSTTSASPLPPDDSSLSQAVSTRQQPIPPASEPMQYRAIGLVRGRYVASEEQFTRGAVVTEDGVPIDAVLLGRVMSLVKKHLDLDQPHLWVVYPRTRERDNDLHVQIVGVWEPEKLNRADETENALAEDASSSSEEDTSSAEDAVLETPDVGDEEAPAAISEAIAEAAPLDDLDDKYFSVRGEVVYQSPEDQRLLIKIRRAPRQGSDESKIFKVALKGVLEGKAVGYFWDLHVQRQQNQLVVQEGKMIAMVPPQKRSKSERSSPPRRGGGPSGPPRRKPWGAPREGQRPTRSGGERPSAPSPQRQQPIAKPVKRRSQDSSDQ